MTSQDMGQILDSLKIGKAGLVTHDNMVVYAFAASIRIRQNAEL
jgi:hypothetical protein